MERGPRLPQRETDMKVSILVPVYNEAKSLPHLYEEIRQVIDAHQWAVEVIFVDDGSEDDSAEVLTDIASRDPRFTVLRFSRNFGQTAAIRAAIDHATGDVLVPIDADLQNDPADIPRLIAKLAEGYEVVSGWRRDRKEPWLTRRIPTIVANRLISWTTGLRLHDYGCTLKAYRAGVLKGDHLVGEMHRFVPIFAWWRGGRVAEVVVSDRSRRYGSSNYGLGRTFKVLVDLLTIKFLTDYSTKPAYVFGGGGLILVVLGFLTAAGVVVEKVVWDAWPHKMTMLLLATFLATVGVVLVGLGLLAELIVRIYHGQQLGRTYILRSDLEGSGESSPSWKHSDSS